MDDAHVDDWDRYGWDGYFALIKRHIEWETVEIEELAHKRDTERDLRAVSDDVLAAHVNWIKESKGNLYANLVNLCGNWMGVDNLSKWYDRDPRAVSAALLALWAPDVGSPGGIPPRDQVIVRIRHFSAQMPKSVIRGTGSRLSVIAALLLRIDAHQYPPFMRTMFHDTYEFTGQRSPPADADEGTLYGHALTFLDRLIEKARARRLDRPRNRLEAQSVVYMLRSKVKP